jgi:hypothetical protein
LFVSVAAALTDVSLQCGAKNNSFFCVISLAVFCEKREALRNKRYWLKFLAAQKAKNKKNGHSVESDESHEAEESSEEESEEESRGGEDNNLEVDLG